MKSDFFGGLAPRTQQGSVYVSRRKELIDSIKMQFADVSEGIVILFAAFESGAQRFRQDKSFYYYTGINEPAVALVIDLSNKSTLYIPDYFEKRSQWMVLSSAFMDRDFKALGVDAVELLGKECAGYEFNSYFSSDEYAHMIHLLTDTIATGGSLFTLAGSSETSMNTRFILDHLQKFIPTLPHAVKDISALVARSRRRKDIAEIEHLYRAVEITELAHESAVQMIKEGNSEAEVQASLEYIMTASQARPSFPSIVASGKNSTVLHYNQNNAPLKNGDVVVVDIGAEFNNYCADLTRTYPVSGVFSQRQKELYTIVLEAQAYVAECAKPGMWLKNGDNPEQSLHHLAQKFISSRGYGKYFPHGIGHFLGLDVHDVGDYSVPLHEGDVITIEPGIYIPEESIGIRIEDNYWITKDGAVCLSDNLPKDIADIETAVQHAQSALSQQADDEDYYDDEDDEEDDDMYN